MFTLTPFLSVAETGGLSGSIMVCGRYAAA
jgi:hypothetical protein